VWLQHRRLALLAMLAASTGCAGLRELGFSSRVLHAVPSPDGRFVAVCQEVPVLDGPNYDIRLHLREGGAVRPLARLGDGDPCTQLVWSPDSRRLASISAHVARAVIVDIEDDGELTGRRGPRTVSLTWPEGSARNVRFVSPTLMEFDACDADDTSHRLHCIAPYERRRLDISVTPARGVALRAGRFHN
jgi:hypothetical protein